MCKSIVDTIKDKSSLLDQWRDVHEAEYGETHDIPPSGKMHMSKLNEATINSDNCNAATKTSVLFIDEVKNAVKEKMDEMGETGDPLVIQQACHHHLRNVWIGAVSKNLSKHLDGILATDLEDIDARYRVNTKMDAILRAVDKEFSLPANYPKGHGDEFKHWLKEYHPGALLVPVLRATGSRQDLAVEGAGAVYWNRK